MTPRGATLGMLLLALAAHARDDARPAAPAPQKSEGLESRADPASTALQASVRASLAKGLDYLAARQAELRDGSLPSDQAVHRVPVPVAALAALAFMAGGSQPDRGPHGKALSAAIDYLCAHAEMSAGAPERGYIASDGDPLSRMHGHGFATLALSQAYSMSPRSPRGERTASVLAAAVEHIQRCQGVEGGWLYDPRPTAEHENSVTVTLVAALRGAHNVGVRVDPETIARAVDYVRRCQNEDGSFRYQLAAGTPSTLALTAASLSTLNAAGHYETPEVQRGMTRLWQDLEAPALTRGGPSYPYYQRMYVAEALWHHRDLRLFERWMDAEARTLVTSQALDGSWSDSDFGPCYATASNCLVLAIPLGLLPIHQR